MNSTENVKLAFDSQIKLLQKVGGISKYFDDLIYGLTLQSRIEIVSPEHANIIHATFYNGLPKAKRNQRLVCSLYDMVPELFPDQFCLGRIRNLVGIGPHANKKKWLERSDLIISISQASAKSLVSIWPKLEKKIAVVHLGTRIQNSPLKQVNMVRDRRFWLIVGKRNGYKNGTTLIKALGKLTSIKSLPVLFAAGGGGWSVEEKSLINQNRISDFVIQQEVSDSELAWLYRNAEVVLIPSKAEGFSLPLIEALASNTPVIASDIDVHREVSKEFACLVPASSKGDWVEILYSVTKEPLVKPKEMLGTKRWNYLTKYYSVERMTNQHAEEYLKMI